MSRARACAVLVAALLVPACDDAPLPRRAMPTVSGATAERARSSEARADPPTSATAAPAPLAAPHPRSHVERPDWTIDVRQPTSVPSFYARGLKGPLTAPFHGFVVCKVRVLGVHWDDVLIGPDSQGLPDLRVTGPTRTVRLPDDTSTGYAGFPDVRLEPGGTLKLSVDEMDDLVNDAVGTLTMTTDHGFPMEAKEGPLSASCVGVPAEVYAKELADLAEAAERAIGAAAPPFPEIDVEHSDASHRKIDAAREAVRKWAWLAGPDSAEVLGAINRLEDVHAEWMKQLFTALQARLTSDPPPAEWRELPSAKVRVLAGMNGVVELVAKRPLAYDWRTKTLGTIELFMLDDEGERAAPVFVELSADGAKLPPFSAAAAAGARVELMLSRGANAKPLAVLVVEGAKVVVLPFRAKE